MKQTKENSEAMMPISAAEPITMLRRIGSTTFEVSVRFSGTSKETIEDKILRLIGREANDVA
jgi:hypothetical protein